jgi:hypothetical protein
MKTRALAVLLPLLALAGCADNNVSVQVFGICAPPDDECAFQSDCGAYTLAPLILDLGQTDYYWAFLEVHNQMIDNEDVSAGRPNTRDAYVEEFTVDYSSSLGAIPSVTKRVDSGPTVVPVEGSAVTSIHPIPSAVGQYIATTFAVTATPVEVVANVRLRGFLADQSEFETAEFPFPIQVCNGCLGLPACPDPAQVVTGVCPPNVGQFPVALTCE